MQYNNDFDYTGGYYDGYTETEEERRKREQALANTAIQTQEVKTYADGTVERTTKEEMPGEFAPAVQARAVQPVQQQPVQQPVAPISPDTYQRMIQAESRGRDFDAQGRPLTSPKGAMFAAQVMPATAASPGFGVRPAQAQTPEEYNRVGQDYYNAMLQKYGGNEQAAAAAYNAGPGRVDRNMQANAGVLNVSQLPTETQRYLQQVQPQTAQPAQPAQAPAQPAKLGYISPPAGAAQQSAQYISNYQDSQDDPMRLLALRNDETAPEFIRKRAGERAFDLMNKEVQVANAQQQAQQLAQAAASGDRRASNTIAKELQGQDGSYLKMILLGFIDPKLAGEEAVKLGIGNKWTTTTDADGKPALIQVNAKGLPLKGYTTDGNEIATKDLVRYAAGGAKRELDIVGGTFVNDATKEVGRVVTDKRTGQSYIQTDSGRKPMTGFRPQSSAGTLGDMYSRRQQELLQKLSMVGPEKVAGIVAEDEAVNGPLDANTKAAILQRSTQAAPNMGAIPGAPAGAIAPPAMPQTMPPAMPQGAIAPTAMPPAGAPPQQTMPQAAPAATGGTIAERRRAAEAASKGATTAAGVTMDAAAAEVAKSPDTANTIKSIQKSIKVLESGKHNIGSMASGVAGRGPIAQAIGSQFETTDAKNTKQVMDLVQRLAADGLKALGSNPSTVDLEFWTKFKPDASSDPEFVKEWIDSRAGDLQRRVNYARQQMNLEPVFAKDEEQAAYEWTKKNPGDPRSAQIRQKLGL